MYLGPPGTRYTLNEARRPASRVSPIVSGRYEVQTLRGEKGDKTTGRQVLVFGRYSPRCGARRSAGHLLPGEMTIETRRVCETLRVFSFDGAGQASGRGGNSGLRFSSRMASSRRINHPRRLQNGLAADPVRALFHRSQQPAQPQAQRGDRQRRRHGRRCEKQAGVGHEQVLEAVMVEDISHTSGEYLARLSMTPRSQMLKSPANPGRFNERFDP